ncbi:hypothetical protein DRP53_10335, partial [candidate division WOR-3 bacterium]
MLSSRVAQTKLKVVEAWFSKRNSKTQEEIAASYNISSRTLRRWVKLYLSGEKGKLRLMNRYQRPWNRFDPEIEKRIAQLKEKRPWLTLSETQKTLAQWGLRISKRGIRLVWRRFGLGGFIKGRFSLNYTDFIAPTKETSSGLEMAAEVLKNGKVKEAAQILNSLPSCPKNELLGQIPDRYLSLPRKVEKLDLLFGKIPFRELRRRAKGLRERAEKRGLLYLAARAGVMEALALDWLEESDSLLLLIARLKDYLRKKPGARLGGDPSLRFTLLILEGKALSGLLRVKDVLRCAKLCRNILRQFPSSANAHEGLASLYESIGHFKEAGKIYRTLDSIESPENALLIANIEAIAGRYRDALGLLKVAKPKLDKLVQPRGSAVRAICYLGQGKIDQAAKVLQLSIQSAKKEVIRNMVHTSTLLMAACYAANRELKKARMFLRRYIPLLRKFKIERELIMRYI